MNLIFLFILDATFLAKSIPLPKTTISMSFEGRFNKISRTNPPITKEEPYFI